MLKHVLNILFSKKLFFLIIFSISTIVGYVYSTFQTSSYIAKTSFIVEDTKSGIPGLGGNISSLAGQLGVDIGGASSNNLLTSDNIVFYFKSESITKKILSDNYPLDSNKTFADVYSEIYEHKNKWYKYFDNKKIDFKNNKKELISQRLRDSLISVLATEIIKKRFEIDKIDKKSSIILLKVNTNNELFTLYFSELLLNEAIKRYISFKNSKQLQLVSQLQNKADSISSLLEISTLKNYQFQQNNSVMDINPLYRANPSSQLDKSSRDKTMLSAMMSSVVQNLELAKFSLNQNTPIIQIIDNPSLPLQVIKPSKIKYILFFNLFFFFLGLIFQLLYPRIKTSL